MTKPLRVGVFHPGSQHSLQTAIAFQESGQLAWHATTIYYRPDRLPYRLERMLPAGPPRGSTREFRRRYDPELDPRHVRALGIDEWVEVIARRLRLTALADAINIGGNRRFGKRVDPADRARAGGRGMGLQYVGARGVPLGKPRGIRCVLDQTIGHPRAMNAMFEAEYGVHPDYFVARVTPFDASRHSAPGRRGCACRHGGLRFGVLC